MNLHQISLNPYKTIRFLTVVAVLLTLASVMGQLSTYLFGHNHLRGFVPLFQLNRENNIPTFFSVLLMTFSTILLLVITLLNSKQNAPHVSKWAFLSFGFLYMTYDEAFEGHELLIRPGRALLGGDNFGIFYFTWIVFAIPLVIILLLFFIKFLKDLPVKTRHNFLISAILFLGGCIGIEMIGGWYDELYGRLNLTYNLIANVEESLEMAGLIVFIWGLMKYIADNFKEVKFRFDFVKKQSDLDSQNIE